MFADRLEQAYRTVRTDLLNERTAAGHWVGELSTSALATATAITALHLVSRQGSSDLDLVHSGADWLRRHQNDDGGWGDTPRSFSNISTTMLCRAAMSLVDRQRPETRLSLQRCESWLTPFGTTAETLAESVRNRYGKDRTFSVPILMMCALAGLVPWKEIPRLPFELACIPQSWYRFARMPVVSYALPALIAIGQVIHAHRPTLNPYSLITRRLARSRSLAVLERIQPPGGGFLEATPLTSFVTMSLASLQRRDPVADRVIEHGLGFLRRSMREDGGWPIDTNLSVWVSTLAINALAASDDLNSIDGREALLDWLLRQQTGTVHPYTGAAPGAWGWSDEPGSVPDCDDTPGAVLAIHALAGESQGGSLRRAVTWMQNLQNRDGGFPTFCRGWGKLPFDRSGTDLTAHVLRAVWAVDCQSIESAFVYLTRQQRADGSWLPLWFGNQHAPDDINPVYGTAKVLAAYRDLGRSTDLPARRGVEFLRSLQNPDGGWGGNQGTPSSVEETALAVEVLLGLVPRDRLGWVQRGVEFLLQKVEDGSYRTPAPIGFYFAKLWYFEKLYPIIWSLAALGRARHCEFPENLP